MLKKKISTTVHQKFNLYMNYTAVFCITTAKQFFSDLLGIYHHPFYQSRTDDKFNYPLPWQLRDWECCFESWNPNHGEKLIFHFFFYTNHWCEPSTSWSQYNNSNRLASEWIPKHSPYVTLRTLWFVFILIAENDLLAPLTPYPFN